MLSLLRVLVCIEQVGLGVGSASEVVFGTSASPLLGLHFDPGYQTSQIKSRNLRNCIAPDVVVCQIWSYGLACVKIDLVVRLHFQSAALLPNLLVWNVQENP